MLAINDQLAPSTLKWPKPPENVLVVKKIGHCLFEQLLDVLTYLIHNHRLKVFVEKAVFESEIVRCHPVTRSALESSSLRLFDAAVAQSSPIDFVVCLGGDGTFLHATSLFQAACPPVISIYAGSLGFLCPFDFENYKSYLNGVIKGNVPILYRNRLKFKLEKSKNIEENDYEEFTLLEKPDESRKEEETEKSEIVEECLSINDIIISRGTNSNLSNLDLYANDYLITSVQGDGLIISTPTGSTAYAMAAGSSLCHPGVAAILIVPICPHSLSFRPIVVPTSGIELKIKLNAEARSSNAFCSVDGRVNTRLTHDSHVLITASQYPVPFVCRSDQINEWFEALATCLNWNHRPRQLPLNSGFIGRSRSPSRSPSHSSFSSTSSLASNLSSFYSSSRSLMPPTNDYFNNSLADDNTDEYKSISFNFRLDENDDNNNRVNKDVEN